MIKAAIVGLGRWGKSLVNAVHGKTDEIRFVGNSNLEINCTGKGTKAIGSSTAKLVE